MTVALVVFTDGRYDCLLQTLVSLDEYLYPHSKFTARIVVDDSADSDFNKRITDRFGDYIVLQTVERLGFSGTIQRAWDFLNVLHSHLPIDHVLHWEDDFVLTEPIKVEDLTGVLDRHPHLAQVALKRQAWSPEEKAVGGIIEKNPDAYTQCSDESASWVEHRQFFTTNPSVYRLSLTERRWPQERYSEGKFSISLFGDDPDTRSAFWGRKDDPPRVEHIGTTRIGTGY